MERIVKIGSLLWCFLIFCVQSDAQSPSAVKYLQPGDSHSYKSERNRFGSFGPDLQIYCYAGEEPSIAAIFHSLRFQLTIDNDDFVQYDGESPEEVQTHYENQRTIFSFNVMNVGKRKIIKVDPFNRTCVGIETAHKYDIQLNLVRVDLAKVILLLIGLILFIYAKTLSQTPLFYYLSGICLGVCASFLILVYLASKLFPKRPMMYGMMIGGWTLGIYFIQMLFENLHTIFVVYQTYVFWYVIATGFLSFVVCYRWGPPKNQRSKDLIKWGLQIIANSMIFYSSNYRTASVSIMILAISFYYFPLTLIRKLRGYWMRKFPPKPRLLTSEEFHEQGLLETTRALEELKTYCSSPESKPWRMMTRLKDPQRFASFIEGGAHLLDDEIMDYETTQIDDIDDDDEDSDNLNTEDENESSDDSDK